MLLQGYKPCPSCNNSTQLRGELLDRASSRPPQVIAVPPQQTQCGELVAGWDVRLRGERLSWRSDSAHQQGTKGAAQVESWGGVLTQALLAHKCSKYFGATEVVP